MTPIVQHDQNLKEFYEAAEQKYFDSLPLEHFMEATDHAHQRKITLESFDLIHAIRSDIQCFNELLVQYPRGKRKKLGQVVPDNFVVVHPEPLDAVRLGSFNLPLQPVRPLLVLEYVSPVRRQKDYEDNFKKYETEMKVPYYLLFDIEREELMLFKMGEEKYIQARPNAAGRLAIPELEIEAAVLDGWVRFWFRGERLELPGDLFRDRNAARAELRATKGELTAERQAREALEKEVTRMREELARAKGQ